MDTYSDPEKLRELASAQTLAIWAVLAGILGNVIWSLMIVTVPFMLYAVYRLARGLDKSAGSAAFFMIAMLIPIVGIICLLVLNSSATTRLRDGMLTVGLFGVPKAELAKLGAKTE